MGNSKFTPTAKNVMTIRVRSYENGCIKGVFTSSENLDEIEFCGAIPLILAMENVMDITNTPQRGEESRSFAQAGQRHEPFPELQKRLPHIKGPLLGTFQIHVLFRQNATWQGRMVWVEKNMEASFRSVLELLRLLDSALSE